MAGQRQSLFQTEGGVVLDQQEFKFEIKECTSCQKSFDKDHEDSVKWRVAVRQKEEAHEANFYCPKCWQSAEAFIKDYMNDNG
jgi:uncharacterized protein with PIN domain